MTLVATSLTAVYSTRIIFFALLEQPRFPPVILINENNPSLIKPIKRLLLGSIFAGFIISNNLIPITIPAITMPYYLKLTALFVTFIGFIIAIELNNITRNLKFSTPNNIYKFSNQLGFFPLIIHRLVPKINLMISQKIASMLLDIT